MRVLLVLILVALIGPLTYGAQAASILPADSGVPVLQPRQPIGSTHRIMPLPHANAFYRAPTGIAVQEKSHPSGGRPQQQATQPSGWPTRHVQTSAKAGVFRRAATATEYRLQPENGDRTLATSFAPSCCGPALCIPCGPAGGEALWRSGCCPVFPPNRITARVVYLLWWSSSYRVPAMVTTSAAATPPATAGVLGLPNTSVLFGGGHIGSDVHSGGRLTLDYWLDPCGLAGIEATYLGIGRATTRFAATSDEWPILARPYFDVTNGLEAAMLVAHPDFLTGTIEATSSTEFQSVEVLLRRALARGHINGIDFVVGWRFARLDESLRVAHSSRWSQAQGPIVVGTTKEVVDLFSTRSQFNGAEVGLVYNERYGPWSLDLLVKLGLGNTRSEVFIDGQTITVVPGFGEALFIGGLLAQQTNMGRESQNDFTVIAEAGATLGYNVTYRLRLTFGYTFIYWNKVARPGGQIDRGISQLPPEAPAAAQRPGFAVHTSDYWTQGMNFGLDYRF